MVIGLFTIILVAATVGGLVILGPGLVSAVVAHRKGYRPWFWIFSLGLVGLLVTALMPGLRQAGTPELRDRWETRADWAGGLLSALTLTLMFLIPLLGAMFFVGLPVAKRPVPPPIIASPSIAVEESMMEIEQMQPVPSTDQPESDGK